jgi:hypothetical protein
MQHDTAVKSTNTKIFRTELLKLNQETNSIARWILLERLHIIGQQNVKTHFFVHFLMLQEAFSQKNISEFLGQLVRLFLVVPGHLFNRLPVGNVGTTRVSAFKSMPLPKDLVLTKSDE